MVKIASKLYDNMYILPFITNSSYTSRHKLREVIVIETIIRNF